MIYKLNGVVFNINQEHRIGDVNYPHTWFQDASNRAAMGITEEADPVIVRPIAELRAEAVRVVNAVCEQRIYAKYPLTKQLNVNDIIVDPVYRQQLSDDKAAMLAVCNNATDGLIPAALTEVEIEAIKSSIAWPI